MNSNKKILHRDTFTENFVYIEADAADYIVSRGIRTIGIDYLSIGGYKKNGHYVHQKLLGARILIIEGLDLSGILPGRYDMICLPIKIFNGDGAPARVFLKKKFC
jgi:arylformamidase